MSQQMLQVVWRPDDAREALEAAATVRAQQCRAVLTLDGETFGCDAVGAHTTHTSEALRVRWAVDPCTF